MERCRYWRASSVLAEAFQEVLDVLYDSYENVSKRFRTFTYFVRNIPHILRIPYYGPRVHEKYRKASLIQSLA